MAQFLAMQVWFNFSAVLPVVEQEWQLTPTQSGIIIAFFHVGYVVAIIAYSMLSDKYNPKYSFVFGAILAGLSGLCFSLFASGFWSALLLRTLSGIGIAGIYVPGMRILSSIFPPKQRGKAIGIYVGALVVGSGSSLLVSGLLLNSVGWNGVITVTSLLCLLGAVLVSFLALPQEAFASRGEPLRLSKIKKVFRKPNLLVNGGYAGHCWELYAMWAWIGPFLVYYLITQGVETSSAIRYGNVFGAIVIMIGGFATYYGGRLSDTIGRIKAANLFLFISIFCSLSIGWLLQAPIWVMVLIALLYGFTIVADSPIYNVAITEVSDPDSVAIALGVQSVFGFTVTIFSPIVFGVVLDHFHWGAAFTVIGLVTIIAPICLFTLQKIQHTTGLFFTK
ncbi:MFS transporter [Alkalihalobacillus sp. LMS39]|uniref:MFS transporter n=1 Tax=Alkalihalobacillus sp. LMS39 TaxID=2924032 RepID=UPI002437272E|nr:MFS transporter [Alkalihalobacillus sp. LMS39]